MGVSSGAIQRSKRPRFTSPSMTMSPARKENAASSCADSASFNREADW
jgi:hypothetical protein